ncbi:MAG: hypothetical protein AAGG51_11250 [Cyanobacteria bacterium P01_G01_bin.54]
MSKYRGRRPSQLARLIWNFYRENATEQTRLVPLANCQVFRRWGVLHFRCPNAQVANALLNIRELIALPIAKLRIAHQMKILINHQLIADVPIKFDQLDQKVV